MRGDKNLKALYIFKNNSLYAKLENSQYYLFLNDEFVLAQDKIQEILDIAPEGLDFDIMKNSFNLQDSKEILPFIDNGIGDFQFSWDIDKVESQQYNLSRLEFTNSFPNILKCAINISVEAINPTKDTKINKDIKQNLSLSGYQHKLQAYIKDNIIEDGYGDLILKPTPNDFPRLAVNEHLHINFMSELGFQIPFNALAYDERLKDYIYLTKRFDIDENGKKRSQISLNALMQSRDKYDGSIEKITKFLNHQLDKDQKILLLKFFYANALIYNNDLHKKNISFFPQDNALVLTPIYDTINIYPIKNLSHTQCVLYINGKLNRIKINDFKKASENFDIDFKETQQHLQDIFAIYADKYPQYVKKLNEIPNIAGIKEFKHKLLESYNKCIRLSRINSKHFKNSEAITKTQKQQKPKRRR